MKQCETHKRKYLERFVHTVKVNEVLDSIHIHFMGKNVHQNLFRVLKKVGPSHRFGMT